MQHVEGLFDGVADVVHVFGQVVVVLMTIMALAVMVLLSCLQEQLVVGDSVEVVLEYGVLR